jgi:DNA-binding GntR family transcriptional regulator
MTDEHVPPPYRRVAAHLRSQIISGELQPGEMVPSVRQLAADWDISRGTAEKALALLRTEGLIDPRQGVGGIVRSQAPVYRRVQDRYDSARRTGLIYRQGEYARIVAAELVDAPADVAEALGIDTGAPVVRRHRVTYGPDDVPVASSTTWFVGSIGEAAPALLSTERIREGTAVHVERATGRVLHYGEERIAARLASPGELAELGQDGPAAVLETRHTGFDTAGLPFTFEVGLAPADRWTTYSYEVPPPQETP